MSMSRLLYVRSSGKANSGEANVTGKNKSYAVGYSADYSSTETKGPKTRPTWACRGCKREMVRPVDEDRLCPLCKIASCPPR